MQITNRNNVSLPLAVWLLVDDYDYIDKPNYISATSILKPTKQVVLAKRVPKDSKEIDVSDFISSRMGTAIHDSMERVWTDDEKRTAALRKLGVPKEVCERIAINPTKEQLEENEYLIPIYLEQRSFKEVDGWLVGGKFDMVAEAKIFDNKSTSVWTYIKGNKDEDYRDQLSIYRWLNPDIIEDDYGYIQFIFTDWSKSDVGRIAGYPESRVIEHAVKLLSIEDTEKMVRAKLQDLSRFANASEDDIPECTDKELWRSAPQYKYYSDPDKANEPGARATKNFDTLQEANAYWAEKGKGVVKTIPGEVKACAYCPAFAVCEQRKRYQ